ncbi:MAG: flavin-dependent oxidoreductase, F420-dependent methylene-tetrahydromethanopterin reductase [Actinomycetia bacterium]|nr:flavin-dependent oxidoreductase, F420-dependent methylene-tetrahydromethanopterin reductase [Actinomycetes bacterium]
MRIGFALPHYDYSVPGEWPLSYETLLTYAKHADACGYDSLWMSDHLFLDLAKYGGPSTRAGSYDPLVTLAAIAREVTRPRIGTLVLCEALRPATVLAKGLATLDRVSGGRLDVGLGAGWYEPDYAAIGMEMPPPGVRIDRLREAATICGQLLGGGPVTFAGTYHSAREAWNEPASIQKPRPPLFLGGKGDRLLGLVAELADGWNTCWAWTPDAYRERLAVLERACERVGRDPASVSRSLGLYALVGENASDLGRRFEHLCEVSPAGTMRGATLDEWRVGRLVGTVDEVREQAAGWADLGVETLILGVGAVPFAVTGLEDVALAAETLRQ